MQRLFITIIINILIFKPNVSVMFMQITGKLREILNKKERKDEKITILLLA